MYAIGTAAGFAIAIVLLAGIREKIEHNDVLPSFRGMPMVLLTAGLKRITQHLPCPQPYPSFWIHLRRDTDLKTGLTLHYFSITIFILAPGAFFVLAFLVAVQNKVRVRNKFAKQ